MLYNGEEVGDGTGPEVDVAVDPARGNAPDRARPAERDRRDRGRRARLDVLPWRGRLHGEDRRRRRRRATRSTSTRRRPRTCNAVAKAKGRPGDRHPRRRARARPPRGADRRAAPGRRARQPDPGRRCRARDRRRTAARPASTCSTASAARRKGVISAAALKSVGGGIQAKLWPRNDDERQQLARQPATTWTAFSTTDDLVAGDDVFVAATGVTTGALLRGVRYVRDGAITDSIVHALTLRHGSADRGASQLSASSHISQGGSTDERDRTERTRLRRAALRSGVRPSRARSRRWSEMVGQGRRREDADLGGISEGGRARARRRSRRGSSSTGSTARPSRARRRRGATSLRCRSRSRGRRSSTSSTATRSARRSRSSIPTSRRCSFATTRTATRR